MRISRSIIKPKVELLEGMIIIIDTREQKPLFQDLDKTRRLYKSLPVGDYSLLGFENKITVERKTLEDFLKSITIDRERFKKELEKTRSYLFKALVIEAREEDLMSYNLYSQVEPNAVYNTLASIEAKYNLHIYLNPDRELIETWILSRFKFFYRYMRYNK